MKYCIFCGHELNGGEITCPACNKALPNNTPKQETGQDKGSPKQPKSEAEQIKLTSEPFKTISECEKTNNLEKEDKKVGTPEKEERKIETPEKPQKEKKEKNSDKPEKEKNKTLIFIVIVIICVAAAAAAILIWKNLQAQKINAAIDEAVTNQEDADQDFINEGLPDMAQPEEDYMLGFGIDSIDLIEEGSVYAIPLNTNIPDLSQIYWESSDSSVAAVDENGQVTAVASGTAKITAYWNDLSASCQVTCDIAPAIHEYEFIIADCTWVEAKQDCLDRGGYLVNIDSQEEYDYILSKIQEQNLQDKVFYLGGGRSIDSNVYYWIDKNNQFTGDSLNFTDAWCSGNWMANEPSLKDGDTTENIMTMFFYKGENRWVWNDAPNDITQYYSGKTGYICEYED